MVLDIQSPISSGVRTSTTELIPKLQSAIKDSQHYFLEIQHQEGYWEKPLGADTTLVSDYIMLIHYLNVVDADKQRKAVNYIRRNQLDDGGWNIYYGGPSELNATVKAALALMFAGASKHDPAVTRATECIRRLGGLEKTNSYTRFYMALFGLIPWKWVPAILPEVMFLPTSFYFNIYEISSWSRAILVPMSIIWSQKPKRKPPQGMDVSLWWIHGPDVTHTPKQGGVISWRRFFVTINRILQTSEGLYSHFTRREALRRAKRWLLERVESLRRFGCNLPRNVELDYRARCIRV